MGQLNNGDWEQLEQSPNDEKKPSFKKQNVVWLSPSLEHTKVGYVLFNSPSSIMVLSDWFIHATRGWAGQLWKSNETWSKLQQASH